MTLCFISNYWYPFARVLCQKQEARGCRPRPFFLFYGSVSGFLFDTTPYPDLLVCSPIDQLHLVGSSISFGVGAFLVPSDIVFFEVQQVQSAQIVQNRPGSVFARKIFDPDPA